MFCALSVRPIRQNRAKSSFFMAEILGKGKKFRLSMNNGSLYPFERLNMNGDAEHLFGAKQSFKVRLLEKSNTFGIVVVAND